MVDRTAGSFGRRSLFRQLATLGLVALGATALVGAGLPALDNAAQAAEKVQITSQELAVTVDADFPRVIGYRDTATGAHLFGNQDQLSAVEVDGKLYRPQVESDVRPAGVDYEMTFPNLGGAEIDSSLFVKGPVLTFRVTKIEDVAGHRIGSWSIPHQNLVSVRSTQSNPRWATARVTVNVNGPTGDAYHHLTGSTPVNKEPQGAAYAMLSTTRLAAAVSSSSYYDMPDAHFRKLDRPHAVNSDRVQTQVVARDGYRRLGIWSGDWLHRARRAEALGTGLADDTEPLPWAKVVVTGNRNGDARVDWQDAAIAYRDILPTPTRWREVARRPVQRIEVEYASMATSPFLRILDETKRLYLATDGLGQMAIVKGYASEGHGQPDYGEDVSNRPGGLNELRTLIRQSKKYGADIGMHINENEFYRDASYFDPNLLDHTVDGQLRHATYDRFENPYFLDYRANDQSGHRLARMKKLKAQLPEMSLVYLDIWQGDGYSDREMARDLTDQGWQIATEFADRLLGNSIWSHWSTDTEFGGAYRRGIMSKIIRFISNHRKDVWAPGRELLGNTSIVNTYEGWWGDKDYYAFLNELWGNNVPVKYLQGFPIMRWSDGSIAFSDDVVARSEDGIRTIYKDGHQVLIGDTYLLPWNRDPQDGPKLYHWNPDGGTTTWHLPTDWADVSTLFVYQLSDDGRTLVDTVTATDSTATLTAKPKTAYVVYPKKMPDNPDVDFGEGTPMTDPGFFSGSLDGWELTGSAQKNATVTTNDDGHRALTIKGGGTAMLSQQLTGLQPGATYRASVYVATEQHRRAMLATVQAKHPAQRLWQLVERGCEPRDPKGNCRWTESSPLTNRSRTDQKNGTRLQLMHTVFTVRDDRTPVRLAIGAATGGGKVTFDDVRVHRVAHQPPTGHYLVQNFENTDSGWGPFVPGPAYSPDQPVRTHRSVRNEPFTQRGGFDGKLMDDVIDGDFSLKSHNSLKGIIYRTLPQTLRLKSGHQYEISFDYLSAYDGQYAFVAGTGADTVTSRIILPQSRTPRAISQVVTGAADGTSWIGIRKMTNHTKGVVHDLVIDNLVVKDLGRGRVSTSIQAPQFISAGSEREATITFTNDGPHAVTDVDLNLSPPNDWTVVAKGPTHHGTLAPGRSVTAKFEMAIPEMTNPESYTIEGVTTFSQAGHPTTSRATQRVTLPFSSLKAAYNNNGITDADTYKTGNLGGDPPSSFSAEQLAENGVTPGATVSHNGVQFTWPDGPAGADDNVATSKQTISLSGSGETLAFLGTDLLGGQGAVTIHYTDGTTSTASLGFPQYCCGPTDRFGAEIFVEMVGKYRADIGYGFTDFRYRIYYNEIPINATKQVRAVTLPGRPALHVFGMVLKE